MTERRIDINIPLLTRVEGEGALDLGIGPDGIEELRLRIFEPPRFFEKFLEGRHVSEIPDLVSRICGICPVAYQMSAVSALESLAGTRIGPWIRRMRRLYYCGEWIESHSLHIHLLALPDFLGFSSVADMAAAFPEEVARGLALQGLGNELISLLGARSVNPVGVRPGGFYHAPAPERARALLRKLDIAAGQAEALLQWLLRLPLPAHVQDFTSVSLAGADVYPMMEGEIRSDRGFSCSPEEFAGHFHELQVPYSTALHCLLNGEPYLTGPLARMNLNYPLLDSRIRDAISAAGVVFPSANMYHSIIARAAEVWQAVLESRDILAAYEVSDQPAVEYTPAAGACYGISEAPRGMLWHRYEIDSDGRVLACRIVPPTSQNQARIEQDLRVTLEREGLNSPEPRLRALAEQVIRNYDPCISCATHFLRLRIRHG